MPRPPSTHPTELELEVLKVLWRDGPSPVRNVRDALARARPPRDLAYTTVMTVMSIMTRKGYLRRKKGDGGYVYGPKAPQTSTLRKMLRDLVDRAFSGSAASAVLHLLETEDVTADELRRLRELIDRKAKRRDAPAKDDSSRKEQNP